MFDNYLKVAVRILHRKAVFALLEIFGLAVGLAVAFLIFLFIHYEWSYDRATPNAGRIFRLVSEYRDAHHHRRVPKAFADIGPRLAREIPEILAAARIFKSDYKQLFSAEGRTFYEERAYRADPDIFAVFGWRLQRGDPRRVLNEPRSVVLTASAARKYFGDQDPVGRTLIYQGATKYRVTGVMEDPPEASHLHPDLLISAAGLGEQWRELETYTYILLDEPGSAPHVRKLLRRFLLHYRYSGPYEPGNWLVHALRRLELQPLTRIHLYSRFPEDIEPQGDIRLLIIYGTLGLLTLVVVALNFVNFKTADTLARAREVGVRKTLGATRGQVITQFCTEIGLTALAAMVLAASLAELTLPVFTRLTGKNLRLDYAGEPGVLIGFFLITLGVTFAAGLYPALFMAGFRPAPILRGELPSGRGLQNVRKALVLVQFVITIGFIVATLTMTRQLRFLTGKDPGFDRDRVMAVPAFLLMGPGGFHRYATLKQELMKLPEVAAVTVATSLPGMLNAKVPGPLDLEGFDRPDRVLKGAEAMVVDAGYLSTLGLRLVAGRDFDPGRDRSPVDLAPCLPGGDCGEEVPASFILNETAVKALGWASPEAAVGRRLRWRKTNVTGTVVGVVRDFHTRSFSFPVRPTVLIYFPESARFQPVVALRIRGDDETRALHRVRATWEKVFPGFPFYATFLDLEFRRFYAPVQRLNVLMAALTVIVIVISCFGMLGLAAVTVEQRRREFCIRKVLGASERHILYLLWTDFLRMIGVAGLIAWPLAYGVLQRWLAQFAYHAPQEFGIYVFSGALVAALTLILVTLHGYGIARMNPAPVLRYE